MQLRSFNSLSYADVQDIYLITGSRLSASPSSKASTPFFSPKTDFRPAGDSGCFDNRVHNLKRVEN